MFYLRVSDNFSNLVTLVGTCIIDLTGFIYFMFYFFFFFVFLFEVLGAQFMRDEYEVEDGDPWDKH